MPRAFLLALCASCATGPTVITNSTLELHLIEGTPSSLPDGTTVEVKDPMYAHLGGGRNLSRATLLVTRDGQTTTLSLENPHGPQVETGDALGWTFTLMMADPYQRPSRATVEARKR